MTVASTAKTVIAVHGIKPTSSMFGRRLRRLSAMLLTTTTAPDNTDIAVHRWLLK